MKITEKPNTYRTTNKKLLDGRHDRLINVHCRDHVIRQKSKQRHRSLKLADFHNQSPLLTMFIPEAPHLFRFLPFNSISNFLTRFK